MRLLRTTGTVLGFTLLILLLTLLSSPALLSSPGLDQDQPKQEDPGLLAGLLTVEVETVHITPPQTWDFDPLNPLNPFPFDWRTQPTPLDEQTVVRSGVGFVARADGVIVTSLQLVQGVDRITVALENGTRLSADIVRIHSATHTAVLRVEANDLPSMPLGDTAELEHGAPLTLGYPGEAQLPAGVYAGRAEGNGLVLALFSKNVTAPPGAPLLSEDGCVVGLNAQSLAVALPEGGVLQFTYATPIDTVRRLVAGVRLRGPTQLRSPFDWDWDPRYPPQQPPRD